MKPSEQRRVALERIPYDAVSWDRTIAEHPDAEVFHGSAWLDFLVASQRAEPVVAVVRADGQPVGHFVGAIVRRYGVRILGSPLRGWGTQCMGFLLDDGFPRRAAADALLPFAFRDLGCLHVEFADRQLTAEEMAGSAYEVEKGMTYVVDLASGEEAMMASMRATTRNYIRQAGRKGLVVERCTDASFADEYYEQLVEVFARQRLVPTYGVDRVRQLMRCLVPSDQAFLARARGPGGDSLATVIVVGGDRTAVLWGAAFRRAATPFHPNELLHWEAMRYWRARGAVRYDMGGSGDYKAKYGGVERPTCHFHRSRYRVLGYGRRLVRTGFRVRQIFVGHRRQPGAAEGRGESAPPQAIAATPTPKRRG